MPDLLSIAMKLYDKGLTVTPVSGKKPMIKYWQERRPSREELARSFRSNGITGLGLVTGKLSGNLVCLDFDGEGWNAGVNAVLAAWPELEASLQVLTGSGKLHIYIRCTDLPESFTRRTFHRADLRAAIELRGNRCQSLIPPSIHPDTGKPYRWAQIEADIIDVSFQELERWLEEWSGIISADNLARGARPAKLPEVIPEGQRDVTLTSLAGSMRRRGASFDAILAALREENMRRCRPPLPDEQVVKIAKSVGRYTPEDAAINLTDLGNARRLAALHGDNIRYCYTWGKWLIWHGTHWEIDNTGEIERLAKQTVAEMYAQAAALEDDTQRKQLARWALASESRSRIEAMIALAESEPGIAIDHTVLNKDPYLFNVINGTIDLRTGELREHRREDLITKLSPVPYYPEARSLLWEAFLYRIMDGNEALIRFLQKAVGYSLTGIITDQCLFFMYGTGANGKSTFTETILAMMGDYGQKAPTEMLIARNNTSIPNDVARLVGARFVVAAEVEEGRRLNESVVKDLTGGDRLVARFLHREFFEFDPTHKLWMYGNHKPIVRGTDNGIWRRIRLIPFTVSIPPAEQDTKLREKLRDELPGVLAWAVQGCLRWQEEGLQPPLEVAAATDSYRSEMDVLQAFIQDRCILGEAYRTRASDLYKSYTEWCKENGENPISGTRFSFVMRERGFDRERSSSTGHMIYIGIGLKEPTD